MSVIAQEQATILVVDDAPESLKMLNACLREAGFRVAIAQSGEEALQRAAHISPDLIVLDVIMPGLDGFSVCRRLKADCRTCDVPVIFVTALHDTVDKIKGFETGGVDYLSKPVQPQEVLARVNAHLTIGRLQRELQLQNARLQEKNVQLQQEIMIRQQAEESARMSEQRYRAIVEDQTELICRFLPDFTLTFVNGAYCRYFGKTPADLSGRSFFLFIPEQERARIKQCLANLNLEHPVSVIEHQALLPNGDLGWQQWTNRLIVDKQGNPQEFQTVGRDITERKRIEEELDRYHRELYDLVQERTAELTRINEQLRLEIEEHQRAERALRESEERYRMMYEEAPNPYFSLGTDWRITQCNPAAARFLGYTCLELGQKTLCDLFSGTPDSVPKIEALLQRVLSGAPGQEEELEVQKKDHVLAWISLRVSPVKNLREQGREYRALMVDMTERKLQELAIKAERNHLHRENIALRATLQDRYKFGTIIGKSRAMQVVYEALARAAASDVNVVLYGESGTGKELAAQTIHQLSERRQYAFVPVNCGAVPETLFEREFFGHRKGAFTGADRNQPGYLDRANKGTLFLDEISELSLAMQVKLLRVLQEGEYMPIGATAPKTADLRIIAATNKDLKTLLHQSKIREDFYYRIRVMVINLPPLRERREDLPLLAEHFLKIYQPREDYHSLPEAVMHALYSYDWPGNIREFQNELQRYLAEGRLEFLGNGRMTSDESRQISGEAFQTEGLSFHEAVAAFEKSLIARALAQHHGHQGKTSKALDIPPKTLYRKIQQYKLKTTEIPHNQRS